MRTERTSHATWTARDDAVVEIVSPEVAAMKLGRTVEAILGRRRELGLPEPGARRRRKRAKQTGPSPRWSPEEDALIRKLPPSEAAQKTGRTRAAVMNRRSKLLKEEGLEKKRRQATRSR
jgi:hypothetical protein